jgi:hypothetical protein
MAEHLLTECRENDSKTPSLEIPKSADTDIKICRCASPLYKMMQYLYMT